MSDVIGPAEVFAIASTQDWLHETRVLLIGVEAQPTIAEDVALDVVHPKGRLRKKRGNW